MRKKFSIRVFAISISVLVALSLLATEVDKDTRLSDGKLSQATYVYTIEVHKGTVEYEVEVNAATGEARIVDVEN